MSEEFYLAETKPIDHDNSLAHVIYTSDVDKIKENFIEKKICAGR
ncbi:hypothetical protein [Xenorhabdus sp. PB62.4]|nr:hypothetical protein [Xenorhabdus sp. PB62.4]MBC8952944.1 Fis family transcriptional regulator [Xenorhabdus sp. PB62.4]